jgi:hypothetical protein
MNARVKYGADIVSDFDALIGKYPSTQFASPRRSTVPLLAYWRHPQSRCVDFCRLLNLPLPGAVDLSFEHQVPVRGGTGKPSFTDLMITGNSVAVAVEAKYREPSYQKVRAWLGDSPSDNRKAVLKGWLDLIGRVVGVTLDRDDVMDITYQTIHRTASACDWQEKNPAITRLVVYQHFVDAKNDTEKYDNDLKAFKGLLPDGTVRFARLSFLLEKKPVFVGMEGRWDRDGERHMTEEVKTGLLKGTLLGFSALEPLIL